MQIKTEDYINLSSNCSSWIDTLKTRIAYWPNLEHVGKKTMRAVEDTFIPFRHDNFWLLSKQYYALAWSLFTADSVTNILVPYSGSVGQDVDKEHQRELSNIISNHGWGLAPSLGLSHLSCELALKAICLHSSPELEKPISFTGTHYLDELIEELNPEMQLELSDKFLNWEGNSGRLELRKITENSGPRFIQQRYGGITSINQIECGSLSLSRFIHSEFIK